MAIVLCERQEKINKDLLNQLSENTVVFSSDYYAGKSFIKQQASSEYEYYYLYRNKLYSLEIPEDIKHLQRVFISGDDYAEAKTFNEFLTNVSRIKGLNQWLFYPMIIQLEHTNRCNARCIMCGHANVDKRKCFDMADDTFGKIEELLPFCKYVGLHGYGDSRTMLLGQHSRYAKTAVRPYRIWHDGRELTRLPSPPAQGQALRAGQHFNDSVASEHPDAPKPWSNQGFEGNLPLQRI